MCSVFEHIDELVAKAVLEGHTFAVDPPRDRAEPLRARRSRTRRRPIPPGKLNTSSSLNGSVVYQPLSFSQMTGGFRHSSMVVHIEKVGREVVAVDDQVRPVTDADLVDRAEQLVCGVPGEDV